MNLTSLALNPLTSLVAIFIAVSLLLALMAAWIISIAKRDEINVVHGEPSLTARISKIKRPRYVAGPTYNKGKSHG